MALQQLQQFCTCVNVVCNDSIVAKENLRCINLALLVRASVLRFQWMRLVICLTGIGGATVGRAGGRDGRLPLILSFFPATAAL